MKTKKEIKKQKQKDIEFIISAVTSELYDKAYYYIILKRGRMKVVWDGSLTSVLI